jgi:hypothetical protein
VTIGRGSEKINTPRVLFINREERRPNAQMTSTKKLPAQ